MQYCRCLTRRASYLDRLLGATKGRLEHHSRACAGGLQFRDALDETWRWRERWCLKRDIDVDAETVCCVTEEVVH